MTTQADMKLVAHTIAAFNAIPGQLHEDLMKDYKVPVILAKLVESGEVSQFSRKARERMIDAMNVFGYIKEVMYETTCWRPNMEIIAEAEKRYVTFLNNLTPTTRNKWYEYK